MKKKSLKFSDEDDSFVSEAERQMVERIIRENNFKLKIIDRTLDYSELKALLVETYKEEPINHFLMVRVTVNNVPQGMAIYSSKCVSSRWVIFLHKKFSSIQLKYRNTLFGREGGDCNVLTESVFNCK